MAGIKVINKLNGGIDTDTTPEALNNTKLRDAENVDILDTGKYSKLTNIRGTTNILTYLPNDTDLDTLNVLGVFNAQLLVDWVGDLNFELHKSLVIYTYDSVGGSQIFVVDLITNQSVKFYPNVTSTESLDFPVEGTVSASFTQERGIPQIYWDDNKNELRSLVLKYSIAPSFVFPNLNAINVRQRASNSFPVFTGYGTDGFTTAGTYQVSFRFYNTTNNSATKWSLFTNPIPISNENGCTLSVPIGDGGAIGEIITKTIKLSIDFANTPSEFYNSIQLAVVKNIDGLPIPSNTVYITLPTTEWYDDPTDIEYSDGISFIAPYPLEQIILEDAAIKSAKTQLIKENVLVRGNITYNDFTNDRGKADYDDAYTIKRGVCYNSGSDAVDYKGYFRGEVYAYAVAYYDKFFNFGLVEPLDFAKVYKMQPKRSLTLTSLGTPDVYNQLTMVVSSTTDLVCGDYLRYLDKAYQVCEVNSGTSMLVKYRPDLTTTSIGTDVEILYGQEGNQTPSWSWKFPSRSDNKFALQGASTIPNALGLHIKGLKNHPSWAVGFCIVRQDRIKNIIFQSPHIPTVAVQGVPTQGIGPGTRPVATLFDVSTFDETLLDYKGELDCIAPKTFGRGCAMNVAKVYLPEYGDAGYFKKFGDDDNYWLAYESVYTRQQKTFTNGRAYDTGFIYDKQYGAETPRALCVVPPDYVLNNGGKPTFNNDFTGSEKIEIVDAVALVKSSKAYGGVLDRANYFNSISFFYTEDAYILSNITDKNYFAKLNTFDTDIDDVSVEKNIDLVLSNEPVTIADYVFESNLYDKINIFGGVEQLSQQQGTSEAIPSSTENFVGLVPNQRGIFIVTNKPLLDFSWELYDNVFNEDTNPFPSIDWADYTDRMYDTADMEDFIGKLTYAEVAPPAFNYLYDAPVKDVFVYDDKVGNGAYILNITKGLPDNRYNMISTNWKFTGAYHAFTEDEVTNNIPIDIDVWGGDCFITNYEVKVNNNTPRISDTFYSNPLFADDYPSPIPASGNWFFQKSTKTGCYNNNVEILQLLIESEVNTGAIKLNERIPADTSPVSYYSKPFLYQYNGSFSINNVLKAFVTKIPDIIKNFNYQARFVWSKTRLYEAEGSAFINTEGFDFFPVNNKKDLDEQYGGITALVNFGDYILYLIQEHKVRQEPINRTITDTANNENVVMLSTNFVGLSGQYLQFNNGSQHIRSVQSFNGNCYFMDASRRMMIMFGAGGYNVLSQNGVNKYFLDNYSNAHLIKEKDLLGFLDTTQEKDEYWLIKGLHGEVGASAIIYNNKAKSFKSKINTGNDLILNGVSNGEFLFITSAKSLFTAYTNDKFGYLLDDYRPSKFTMIVNDYPSYTKTFNVMNFEMKGGFILNKDNIFATTPSNLPGVTQQTPDMLIWDNTTGQLPPFQNRNFQYWLNRIRQAGTQYKLRGDYMIVDFTINNDLADNREVSVASIVTECEINARVR